MGEEQNEKQLKTKHVSSSLRFTTAHNTMGEGELGFTLLAYIYIWT